eukprot:4427322-Prymnesium_polylepis.1
MPTCKEEPKGKHATRNKMKADAAAALATAYGSATAVAKASPAFAQGPQSDPAFAAAAPCPPLIGAATKGASQPPRAS